MKMETVLGLANRVCDVALTNGVKDRELRSAIVELVLAINQEQKPTANVYVDGVRQAAKIKVNMPAADAFTDRHMPL